MKKRVPSGLKMTQRPCPIGSNLPRLILELPHLGQSLSGSTATTLVFPSTGVHCFGWEPSRRVPHFQHESKRSSNASPQVGQVDGSVRGGASANSGTSASRFHSLPPSACSLVSESTRQGVVALFESLQAARREGSDWIERVALPELETLARAEKGNSTYRLRGKMS